MASVRTVPVPQKGSYKVVRSGPARLIMIWASLGGSMPTRASRAGLSKSRLE